MKLKEMNIVGVAGAIMKKGKDIKKALKFMETPVAHESYIRQQKSMEEMEAFNVKLQLDAIGLFLESCVDENGFQEYKWPVLQDFANSMGYEIRRCFKKNIMKPSWNRAEKAPAFYVIGRGVSQSKKDVCEMGGYKILGYDLMRYDYEIVTNSEGTHRIFKQKFVGSPRYEQVKEA